MICGALFFALLLSFVLLLSCRGGRTETLDSKSNEPVSIQSNQQVYIGSVGDDVTYLEVRGPEAIKRSNASTICADAAPELQQTQWKKADQWAVATYFALNSSIKDRIAHSSKWLVLKLDPATRLPATGPVAAGPVAAGTPVMLVSQYLDGKNQWIRALRSGIPGTDGACGATDACRYSTEATDPLMCAVAQPFDFELQDGKWKLMDHFLWYIEPIEANGSPTFGRSLRIKNKKTNQYLRRIGSVTLATEANKPRQRSMSMPVAVGKAPGDASDQWVMEHVASDVPLNRGCIASCPDQWFGDGATCVSGQGATMVFNSNDYTQRLERIAASRLSWSACTDGFETENHSILPCEFSCPDGYIGSGNNTGDTCVQLVHSDDKMPKTCPATFYWGTLDADQRIASAANLGTMYKCPALTNPTWPACKGARGASRRKKT